MKTRFLGCLFVAAGFVCEVTPLNAATTINASTFAALCASAGPSDTVNIDNNTNVVGGNAVIMDCHVKVAPGRRLRFVGVTLTGCLDEILDHKPFNIVGGDGSQVDIINSVILMADQLYFSLSSWPCCVGGPANNQQVNVVNSTLAYCRPKGSDVGDRDIRIEASPDGTGGTVTIKNSTLTSQDGFTILTGTSGRTVVNNSILTGGQGIGISSGDSGETVAKGNVLGAKSDDLVIGTGSGGSCISLKNVPPTPCSP